MLSRCASRAASAACGAARSAALRRFSPAAAPSASASASAVASAASASARTATSASAASSARPAALSGIRVLDLSRILAGPSCTQQLGDLGAEVWKIESLSGDDTRFWGPPFVKPKQTPVISSPLSTANAYVSTGESAYFLSVNRNKHSLAVNLKSADGAQIVRQLAQHADVVVENFMPGQLAKFGLDYASLQQSNPSLIYASLTGFGSSGPLAHTPGYDVMASARGGLIGITGSPEAPSKVGVAITDLSTGLVLHGAILAALFARERDPQRRGQLIETNLLSVQVANLANIGQNYLCDPRMIGRRIEDSAHESIAPYQAFRCKPETDDQPAASSPAAAPSSAPIAASPSASAAEYFICGALNNKQFKNLTKVVELLAQEAECGKLDVSWIHDAKFAVNADRVKNRGELIPHLQSVFERFPQRRLLELMAQFDIPSAPINNLAQVFAEPQVQHSGIVKTIQHPLIGDLRVTSSPVTYSDTPTQIRMPPPLLGQHTQEVLKRVLGSSSEQLKRWEKEGVIGSYAPIE